MSRLSGILLALAICLLVIADHSTLRGVHCHLSNEQEQEHPDETNQLHQHQPPSSIQPVPMQPQQQQQHNQPQQHQPQEHQDHQQQQQAAQNTQQQQNQQSHHNSQQHSAGADSQHQQHEAEPAHEHQQSQPQQHNEHQLDHHVISTQLFGSGSSSGSGTTQKSPYESLASHPSGAYTVNAIHDTQQQQAPHPTSQDTSQVSSQQPQQQQQHSNQQPQPHPSQQQHTNQQQQSFQQQHQQPEYPAQQPSQQPTQHVPTSSNNNQQQQQQQQASSHNQDMAPSVPRIIKPPNYRQLTLKEMINVPAQQQQQQQQQGSVQMPSGPQTAPNSQLLVSTPTSTRRPQVIQKVPVNNGNGGGNNQQTMPVQQQNMGQATGHEQQFQQSLATSVMQQQLQQQQQLNNEMRMQMLGQHQQQQQQPQMAIGPQQMSNVQQQQPQAIQMVNSQPAPPPQSTMQQQQSTSNNFKYQPAPLPPPPPPQPMPMPPLYLGHNPFIEILRPLSYADDNIVTLNLSHSHIYEIDGDAFVGQRFEHIDLSNNKLGLIHSRSFRIGPAHSRHTPFNPAGMMAGGGAGSGHNSSAAGGVGGGSLKGAGGAGHHQAAHHYATRRPPPAHPKSVTIDFSHNPAIVALSGAFDHIDVPSALLNFTNSTVELKFGAFKKYFKEHPGHIVDIDTVDCCDQEWLLGYKHNFVARTHCAHDPNLYLLKVSQQTIIDSCIAYVTSARHSMTMPGSGIIHSAAANMPRHPPGSHTDNQQYLTYLILGGTAMILTSLSIYIIFYMFSLKAAFVYANQMQSNQKN